MSQPPQGPPPQGPPPQGPPPQGPPGYGPPPGPPPGYGPPTGGGGGLSGGVLALIIAGGLVLAGGAVAAVFAFTGGGSDSPENASVGEFCEGYAGMADVFFDIDLEAPEDEQLERMVAALKSWASDVEEIGTPADMPDDAREGFDLMLETVDGWDAGDFESLDDLESLDDSFSDEEQGTFDALEDYVSAQEDCQPFGGDLPSASVPTDELPTELPTDDLPTDLPTGDLPTDLDPSDLPTDLTDLESEMSDLESMLSDLPSELATE